MDEYLTIKEVAELTQVAITEWVETAIRVEHKAAGLVAPNNGKAEPKQGGIILMAICKA